MPDSSTSLGQRCIFGALSGMGAATVCHPLDVSRLVGVRIFSCTRRADGAYLFFFHDGS